jgi:hypothetical protein
VSWGETLSLVGILLAQFSLLWYKMGKVEQAVKDHCIRDHPPRPASSTRKGEEHA